MLSRGVQKNQTFDPTGVQNEEFQLNKNILTSHYLFNLKGTSLQYQTMRHILVHVYIAKKKKKKGKHIFDMDYLIIFDFILRILQYNIII